MRYRLLGRTGLRISELFLGAMTFGEQGGVGAPLDECRRMLDAYVEAGGNVIDTASNYRGGESEQIVGELLEGRRDRLVVATKFSVTRDGTDPNAAGGHRKNLRLSLETSLRRLRTDYVDLYWVHIWDSATPIEETVAVARVVDSVADELGISSSQVAIAWTMAKSPVIHPIVGARRLEQLTENMGALTVSLPTDVVSRLDEARAFEVGFPTDFANDVSGWVFGDANQRLVPKRRG